MFSEINRARFVDAISLASVNYILSLQGIDRDLCTELMMKNLPKAVIDGVEYGIKFPRRERGSHEFYFIGLKPDGSETRFTIENFEEAFAHAEYDGKVYKFGMVCRQHGHRHLKTIDIHFGWIHYIGRGRFNYSVFLPQETPYNRQIWYDTLNKEVLENIIRELVTYGNALIIPRHPKFVKQRTDEGRVQWVVYAVANERGETDNIFNVQICTIRDVHFYNDHGCIPENIEKLVDDAIVAAGYELDLWQI